MGLLAFKFKTDTINDIETEAPLCLSKSNPSLESRTPSWSLTMNHRSVNQAFVLTGVSGVSAASALFADVGK